MIIVKFLVFVVDTRLCQFAGQEARSEMQLIWVAAATIKVEQLERAQNLLDLRVLDHVHGVVGLPACPDVREPFASLQIKGEAKEKRNQLRIRRVADSHGENIERGHILLGLLNTCQERLI